jgi:hypothetical protein
MCYALKSKGLRKGDRAIIFSMQDWGTIYAVYGCMMAGVTFTLIPPPLDEGKIERGEVTAGAGDSAGATHEVTFTIKVLEGGDGMLKFSGGANKGPQLDNIVITKAG